MEVVSVSMPVLIVPDTRYSESVLLIIGTNVIRYFKGKNLEIVCSPGREAFSALSSAQTVTLNSLLKRPVTLRPFETRTVTGKVHGACLFLQP